MHLCSNVLAFETLAGQHLGDQDCRCGLASCVAREEGWERSCTGITLHSGCCRSCTAHNVDGYDSCADFKPLGIASQGREPEQCSLRQLLKCSKARRSCCWARWPWGIASSSASSKSQRKNEGSTSGFRPSASTLASF